MTSDDKWLSEAISLATQNVSRGGGPFGALVVRDDVVLSTGTNQVTPTLDPTAHAEIVAIRRACTELGEFSLAGCTLVCSCEPCPLCLAAALWSRLDRVLYAADRDDAARAGFDDRRFHQLFSARTEQWQLELNQLRTGEENAPFDAWLANPDRTEY